MAEEHAEQQMIERALTCTIKNKDEGPLAKVSRKWNAGVRRVGIDENVDACRSVKQKIHRERECVCTRERQREQN